MCISQIINNNYPQIQVEKTTDKFQYSFKYLQILCKVEIEEYFIFFITAIKIYSKPGGGGACL